MPNTPDPSTALPPGTNRLIHEKSPYLLQHAHNPVDWYPWGPEAFAKAQRENKPVFLSIGYSTCHWCHVMAHESFESHAIAEILNKHYVSIKVDREVQPDVDKVYMTFVQATTGGGGWPMSVFLTPDRYPFFGGTYFPPTDRFNTPGFATILTYLAEMWRKKPDQLRQSGMDVMSQLQRAISGKGRSDTTSTSADTALGWLPAIEAFDALVDSFDTNEGGFTSAPKFPTPAIIQFLLNFHYHQRVPNSDLSLRSQLATLPVDELQQLRARLGRTLPPTSTNSTPSSCSSDPPESATGNTGPLAAAARHQLDERQHMAAQALAMARLTLDKIDRGGIHDHVGQGFHRYSVDGEWHVPHFEKMLYDQAQLARAYTELFTLTRDPEHERVVHDILEYVRRDLKSPDGGFYSAEDADSKPTRDTPKSVEGAFCVWTMDELVAQLGKDRAKVFAYYFGATAEGNVTERKDPHGEMRGKNVLICRHDWQETLDYYRTHVAPATDGMPALHLQTEAEVKALITEECLPQLAKYRFSHRPRPHRDDKIVVSWNGLMISAYARAYETFDCPEYMNLACEAAQFIEQNLYEPTSQRLLRSWCQGPAPVYGFAEDYAMLIQGLLDLYEATFDMHWLTWAQTLQTSLDTRFWDDGTDTKATSGQAAAVGSGRGGYFQSEAKEDVILKVKDDHDGAEPSANSVALFNLQRLYGYFGLSAYQDKVEKILAQFSPMLRNHPQAAPAMMAGLMTSLKSSSEIIVVGSAQDPQTKEYLKAIRRCYLPNRILIHLAPDADPETHPIAQINPVVKVLAQQQQTAASAASQGPKVYICANFTCELSLSSVAALEDRLDRLY
ncbi:hypothetical protein H4R34_002654 [Dimargaris verticillata]|uniref:Spermatogenesis-associated protein 20-like TRX domain-containing protein n=1 Tax=Dimargaris verticillata TaxID=2761393 RepID=A0A9W8EDW3_9FUNG|nr:hypothetical protein H4R34_002654 [Dimargaris verticillata]